MELSPSVALILTAVVLVVEAVVFVRKKYSFDRMITVMLFTLYIGSVVAITLFPLPIYVYPDQLTTSLKPNLIPLVRIAKEVSEALGDLSDTFTFWRLGVAYLGNILLFVPLGVFLPLVSSRFCGAKKVLLVGLLGSFCIEILQFLIGLAVGYYYRYVDIDDLILNTFGAMVGYAAFITARKVVEAFRS